MRLCLRKCLLHHHFLYANQFPSKKSEMKLAGKANFPKINLLSVRQNAQNLTRNYLFEYGANCLTLNAGILKLN